MNSKEIESAKALDMNAGVKYWVRNLDSDSRSFRLPVSSGWFYPDFVAMLEDERILVVEYKGAHLKNAQTDEKDLIGQCWENQSKGNGLFLTAWQNVDGRDVFEQIDDVINRRGPGKQKGALQV